MGVNLYGPQDFKVVSMVTEQKVNATVKVDGQKYKIWMNERDKTGRSWGMRRPKRPVYYRPGPSTVAQRTVQSGPRPFTFQRDLSRDRPLHATVPFHPFEPFTMDQTPAKPCFNSKKLHFPFLMEAHFLSVALFITCQDAVRSTVECPTRWSTKQCLGESFTLLISYGSYDRSHAIFHACFFQQLVFLSRSLH